MASVAHPAPTASTRHSSAAAWGLPQRRIAGCLAPEVRPSSSPRRTLELMRLPFACVTMAHYPGASTPRQRRGRSWRATFRLANAARSAAPSPTRAVLLVDLASAIGSAGWFTAFALQIAAYVRMLGPVELSNCTLRISLYASASSPGGSRWSRSGS